MIDPRLGDNGGAAVLWMLAVLGHVYAFRFTAHGAEVWLERGDAFDYFGVAFVLVTRLADGALA